MRKALSETRGIGSGDISERVSPYDTIPNLHHGETRRICADNHVVMRLMQFWRRKNPDVPPFHKGIWSIKTIVFDEQEQFAIDEALQAAQENYENLFESMQAKGIDLYTMNEKFLWGDTQSYIFGIGAQALKTLAYHRYVNNQHELAAQSCIKALGLQANRLVSIRHGGCAEIWLMLAHIHASTGQFPQANDFVEEAKQAAMSDDGFGPSPLLPKWFDISFGLNNGWEEAVKSLESDLRDGRRPHPTESVFLPTSFTGWVDP